MKPSTSQDESKELFCLSERACTEWPFRYTPTSSSTLVLPSYDEASSHDKARTIMYSSHDKSLSPSNPATSLSEATLPQDPAAQILARASQTYSIPADKLKEIQDIEDPQERFETAQTLHLAGLAKKAELFTAWAHSHDVISQDEAREILLIEDIEKRYEAAHRAYFPLTAQGQTLALVKEGREKGYMSQQQVAEVYAIEDLNQRFLYAKQLKEDGEKRSFIGASLSKAISHDILSREEASVIAAGKDLEIGIKTVGKLNRFIAAKERDVAAVLELARVEGVIDSRRIHTIASYPLRRQLEEASSLQKLIEKKQGAQDVIWEAVKCHAISRHTAAAMLSEPTEILIEEGKRAADLIREKGEGRGILRHGLDLNVISRSEARSILRLEEIEQLQSELDRVSSLIAVAERSEELLDKGIEVGIITAREAEDIFQERDPYVREEAISTILRIPSDRRILSRFQISNTPVPTPGTDHSAIFIQLPGSTERQEYLVPHLLRVLTDPSDILIVPGVDARLMIDPREYSLVRNARNNQVYGWDDNTARGASVKLLHEYQEMVEKARECRVSGDLIQEEQLNHDAAIHFEAYEALARDREKSLYDTVRQLAREHRGHRIIALIEGSMGDRLAKDEIGRKLRSKLMTCFMKPSIPR